MQEASGGAASSSASLQIDLPTFPHAVLAGLGQAASAPAEQPPTTSASGPWTALQVCPGLPPHLHVGEAGPGVCCNKGFECEGVCTLGPA